MGVLQLDANETTVPFDFHDPTGAAIDKAIRPARAGQRDVPDRTHGGASTPSSGLLDPTGFEVDQVVL
jgi:hypothetical protein